MTDKIPPSDEFIARLVSDKEKGLTGKQIQEFHGITKNQYDYIMYRMVPRLKKSPNFVSKVNPSPSKAPQSEDDFFTFITGASRSVWGITDKKPEPKKSLIKALVSKIFFWYK
jgi:hypothetical protein|tara:strand:+ start:379 stop:717 length:339 start_codon:yes stop_codon:yes gene_type:complete